MFLSIIIPVYNVEKYLAECLDSCLNQGLPAEDYEILCVNDGSPDGSAEILSAYERRYPNIRVLTKENGGVSSARNLGLDHAQGDYVWFVDADDVIIQESLGLFYEQAKISEFPDRMKMLAFEFYDEFSSEIINEPKNEPLDGGDNLITLSLLSLKRIQERSLRFQAGIYYGEDTLFLYQFIKGGLSEIDMNKPVYCIRYHSASATKSASAESLARQASSYFAVAEYYKTDYDSSRYSGALDQYAADQMMMLFRKGLEAVAKMEAKQRRKVIHAFAEKGLYPVHQPSCCTYTARECMNEPSGTGKLRNLFRYYSVHPWGLFLASVPYSAQRAKIRVSRVLRANPAMNRALDLKNRLLGR